MISAIPVAVAVVGAVEVVTAVAVRVVQDLLLQREVYPSHGSFKSVFIMLYF